MRVIEVLLLRDGDEWLIYGSPGTTALWQLTTQFLEDDFETSCLPLPEPLTPYLENPEKILKSEYRSLE